MEIDQLGQVEKTDYNSPQNIHKTHTIFWNFLKYILKLLIRVFAHNYQNIHTHNFIKV